MNQQKIDAGFGIDVPTTYPNTKKGNINTKSSSLGVSDIESNVSDMSDTATEVIGYATGTNSRPNSKSSNRPPSHKHNNIQEHGDANILSPRPGAQRAILEIASQMTPEDIMEVIELLNSMKSQGNHQPPIPSPYSNYSSSFPPTQSYHHNSSPHSNNYPAAPTPSSRDPHKVTPPHPPSPQARRGKSGPPLLQSSNYVIGEEDEEVIQHTIHNETYRLIPPLSGPMSSSMSTLIHTNHNGSYSTTPSTLYGSYQSKHYRSGSAASNASGTNSTCNSRSSTPIHKRSPVPMNQHDICPTVNRDSNPPRSADTATPTPPKPIVVPPIVLPQSEIIETNPPAPVSQKQNNSKPTSKENNTGRNALLEYMHSPRSAFDDCSLSSSSSNFTSASNRSAKSKGSSTVKGNNTTSRRN